MREVFDLLSCIQQRTGLHLLIIGAWALHAHGFSRNTNDVDCMTAVISSVALREICDQFGTPQLTARLAEFL